MRLAALELERLTDLEAVFITHHHVDHFIGLDRIVRANLDRDKTLQLYGPEGTIRKVYDRIKSYEYPFFPFQKIVLKVHEIVDGRLLRGESGMHAVDSPNRRSSSGRSRAPYLSFSRTTIWRSRRLWSITRCRVWRSHWWKNPGAHPDAAHLEQGPLRRGPWVAEVLRLLRAGTSPETPVEIDGGRFRSDRSPSATSPSRKGHASPTSRIRPGARARVPRCSSWRTGPGDSTAILTTPPPSSARPRRIVT